jgi:seryl-tRNA synthetase
MLQIQVLRDYPQWVKNKLLSRYFDKIELVDEILDADITRKGIQSEIEQIQTLINLKSGSIGKFMKSGRSGNIEEEKAEVVKAKEKLIELKNDIKICDKEIHDRLVLLPNLPDILVPLGKSAEENEIIASPTDLPTLDSKNNKPHWELIEEYNLVNFELGSKITGRGFPLYINKGAKLQRALTQYFLNFNVDAGYTEYIPPFMVNEESAFATGQLPDKEGQMYHVTEDNFFLIPTAEVPVTNIYRDTVLKESDLPIKMTAHSPCFRREAGSFGKDVRGLNRVHQFEKVEIVQIVHPEKSEDALNEMVNHVGSLLTSLELPYRILRLCGGDMGFTSSITYDFEVWSAAQEKWLEVSSVSNFKTFQTNRLKCRFKDIEGKNRLAHSLNGSSLALPRIFAALIENNQTEEGILIPEALQSYFGSNIIKK